MIIPPYGSNHRQFVRQSIRGEKGATTLDTVEAHILVPLLIPAIVGGHYCPLMLMMLYLMAMFIFTIFADKCGHGFYSLWLPGDTYYTPQVSKLDK